MNAFTYVSRVEVGHNTLISGEGKLIKEEGPVRTWKERYHSILEKYSKRTIL